MTLRNNRERGVDAPRRLTPAEQEAVQSRRPVRYAAAQNVARAIELSFPRLFEPVIQHEVPAPAPVATPNVVHMDSYREQPQAYIQPEVSEASQAELARQAIANIFGPEQEHTDVKEAA